MGIEGTWIEIRLPKGDEPAQLLFHDDGNGAASLPEPREGGFVVIRWWDATDKPLCPLCSYDPRNPSRPP